jgi:hypothetical protein
MNIRNMLFWVAMVFVSTTFPCVAKEGIVLNEQEYFSGPGFSFLLFHNNYQVGFQGGLQMILADERVLDSGDLFLMPKRGQGRPELRVLRRVVDRAQQSATVFGEIEGWSSGYQLITKTDGRSILITLKPPLLFAQAVSRSVRGGADPGDDGGLRAGRAPREQRELHLRSRSRLAADCIRTQARIGHTFRAE